METMSFGHMPTRFDHRVLRPRLWTLAQSRWAAELQDELPAGGLLELCAGVGHIGLMAASLLLRDLVLVDIDARACAYARHNAEAADLPVRVDVRHGPLEIALLPEERFALILADPPWVPSEDVGRFPEDPVTAIDGGLDGLDLATLCVEGMRRHLCDGGVGILQLGDQQQAMHIAASLGASSGSGETADLCVEEVRDVADANGVLVKLRRSAR